MIDLGPLVRRLVPKTIRRHCALIALLITPDEFGLIALFDDAEQPGTDTTIFLVRACHRYRGVVCIGP